MLCCFCVQCAAQALSSDFDPQAWYAAGEGSQAVATAVATGLVAAYADLRQLQFLLQSLLDALLAQMPPTAAAVLCVAPFVQVLQKVRQTRALPGWCGASS